MTETVGAIERLPSGRVEAPQRYIDYEGQVIVRTRYATCQRWKTSGWDRRQVPLPYILPRNACRPRPDRGAANDHLATDEFQVYYVEGCETVRWRVETDAPEDGA